MKWDLIQTKFMELSLLVMNHLVFLETMSLSLFGKNSLQSEVLKPKMSSLDQKKTDTKLACRADVSFITTQPKTGGAVLASQLICQLEKSAAQTVKCFMILVPNTLLIQSLVSKRLTQTVTLVNS